MPASSFDKYEYADFNLDRTDASVFLRSIGCFYAATTLAKFAYDKTGPKYIRRGHNTYYSKRGLIDWANERTAKAQVAA